MKARARLAPAIAITALLGCALPASLRAADAPPNAAAAPGALWAAQAAPADLPANDLARSWLDAEPAVGQARHALEAARQRGLMLEAGPHEWTAKAMAQRRSYRSGDSATSDWSGGVERTLRMGGKAALDRQAGEALVRQAEARLGEARHEAARALLSSWLNWVGADRIRGLWEEQVALAEANLRAAESRRKAGDASMLEQNAARADLADVQRQLSNAANEEGKARARLRARFPQIVLTAPALAPPAPLLPEGALWRERILAESDPLRVAQEELRRAELAADRLRADRTPDPTVGVHAGQEGSRAERIIGFTLSIPIGGKYRDAQGREALQQVEVARSALEAQRREAEAEIAEALADAAGGQERLRFAEAAMQATRESARLTQRAYTLGEADLQALLLARRQSVDAAIGAAQAHVDALRSRYRLLVDAHLIWGLAED